MPVPVPVLVPLPLPLLAPAEAEDGEDEDCTLLVVAVEELSRLLRPPALPCDLSLPFAARDLLPLPLPPPPLAARDLLPLPLPVPVPAAGGVVGYTDTLMLGM